MSYVVILYKSGPIENRKNNGLIMQKSLIAKKLDIENEDLFMVHELYTSAVSCFGIKVFTKNMALFSFVSISGYQFF